MRYGFPFIILLLAFVPIFGFARKIKFKPDLQTLSLNLALGAYNGHFGASAGLEHEHYLTKNGLLTGTLALGITEGFTIRSGEYSINERTISSTTIAVAPGIRLHLMRNAKYADFGIGASFPIGHDKYSEQLLYNNRTIQHLENSALFIAALGQVNCNVTIGKHLFFGGFLNFGTVLHSARLANNFNAGRGTGILQFGLRIGGWW